MKDWPAILKQAIADVNQAFYANTVEYVRYIDERGGRDRPAVAWQLDAEYADRSGVEGGLAADGGSAKANCE
jgi:hypothetical protein